jgi:hypothetical protein
METDIFLPVLSDTAGYWDSTYTNNQLCFGEFVFEHEGYPEYNYWGGFTFGRNGSATNYGYDADSVGSVDWIPHQWGVMASGGIYKYEGAYVTDVEKGVPYLIAYGQEVKAWLQDGAAFDPQGVFICNHPWPFYGNYFGDGFAHKLDTVGAHFILKISGLEETIVTDTLAWCYEDGRLRQPANWHWVDLSEVGETDTLYFELETTDVGEWGPNTALYFCMDKLTVNNLGSKSTAAKKSAVRKSKKTAEEFGDFLMAGTHAAGDAVLYDAQGQVALKANLKAGSNKFDTKHLPAGKYTMIHHRRVKHFIKK